MRRHDGKDYYEILGVPSNSTQEEIKQAWKFCVQAFHPDKFSERQRKAAEERMKAVNDAYGVLSNPIEKANYDRERARQTRTKSAGASHSSPPPAPPPGARTTSPRSTPPTPPRSPEGSVSRSRGNRPVLAAVLCILVFFVIFLVISQRRKPEEAARQVADAATIKKWSDNAIRRGEEWGKQSQPTVPPLALPSPQASTPLNKIPDGSTFGITEVSQTEKPDPKAEMNLTLRIALKKRPNATIDHTKVMIQAFFYDRVDDKDIKLTDADVNYEWLTPKHDWMETNPEILSINYLRPKGIVTSAGRRNGPFDLHPGPKSKVTSAGPFGLGPEPRKYLGYRVLVYYDNKLQAVRAEPARLLNLFPPSPTVVSSFSQDGLKALTRGDYISAGKLFQEAADQGDTTAQSNLASLYVQGKGVPQDYRKAVELYQKAADQGYVLGEVNLGSLHYRGKGVPQDYRKAAELFEKAVSQGDAVGQAYLASQYAEGKGVPQDYRKAAELYHTAVAQGRSPNAFNEFAWFLATCPDDSQRSGREAVSYANKACQLSGWKEANFIGTLAAAYAEVGDFNAAVYYQKRAMDMGSDYPDKQVMEKALKLYQERKPYRE